MTYQNGDTRPMDGFGLLAARPAATAVSPGYLYMASDVNGGTVYQSQSGAWVTITPGVTALPSLHGATHAPGGMDDIYAHMGQASALRVEPYMRSSIIAQPTMTNGTIFLSYVTPPVTLTVTSLIVSVGTTAASGLTLVRAGIFTVAANGDITLVFASADLHTTGAVRLDTSAVIAALSVASVPESLPLTLASDLSTPLANYQLVRGTRYAFGIIAYSSGSPTQNTAHGQLASGTAVLLNQTPRMAGQRVTRTDLDGSIVNASIATSSAMFYLAAA